MDKKLIAITGQGSLVEKVDVINGQTFEEYFNELERELGDTYEEEEIEEFLLGPGEQIVEFKDCKCRVFFNSPENDWIIVTEYSDEVLEVVEEYEDCDELTEVLGLDYI